MPKNKINSISNSLKRFDPKILFIFFIYVLLRLFLSFKAYWIWGDEAKYLACAKSFPFNRMWNSSYYDFHPVFYPYMIKFLSIFFKDHIAAIAVSFFSSIILFFTAYRLFAFLNLKKRVVYIALAYMAFNNVLLYLAKIPFRYELFACLFLLSFSMYLKGITAPTLKYLVLSALFGGLTFMTSDMMPFALLPILLCAFFVFGFKLKDTLQVQFKKLSPIFLIILIYISCVLLPKFIIYSTHTYYASGVEGRIEKVADFGLKQLIHPVYFPNAYAIWGKMQLSIDLNPLHIKTKTFRTIELFKYDDAFYNWCIFIFITIPIFLMLYRILSIRNKSILKEYKRDLYFFAIIPSIIYPVIYTGFIARNSIAVIPFFAYFFAKGVDIFFSAGKIKNITQTNWFKAFLIIFLILLAGMTFKKNRYFIFTLGRIEQCDKVAGVIDNLPFDGIMSEGLIADALVYNSHKRIVALPRTPDPAAAKEQIDLSIKAFDLHYIVLSEFWKIELPILAYPATAYIMNSPDKFKLIKTVYEKYNNGIRSNILRDDDTFYIYEIVKVEK